VVCASEPVFAATYIGFQLSASPSPNGTLYQAFPAGGGPPFVTDEISSADGKITSIFNRSSEALVSPEYSFNNLITALQQNFTFSVNQGLPTADLYTMSVNLGGFAGLTPPAITNSVNGGVVGFTNRTFQFTTPSQYGNFNLQLAHLPPGATQGTFINDAEVSISGGFTTGAVATVQDKISFTTVVPEPASTLAGLAGFIIIFSRHCRRSGRV